MDYYNCVVIFVIDSSDSMSGTKIETINAAIEELVPELKLITECNDDVKIMVNALKICDTPRWLNTTPVRVDCFSWKKLHAGGKRNIGKALAELNSKLSACAFFNDDKLYLKPIIFFMTDGTSSDTFADSMRVLKENKLFESSIRVGVAIGEYADRDFLADFCDSNEHVITVHTPEALKKWIRFEDLT